MTPVCHSATEPQSVTSARGVPVRAQILLAACGCAGASAFLYAVDPSHHAVYPQCWLYNTTGIYCAGCGATRAAYALLHGRLLTALHDNAFFVSALPLILFVVGSYALAGWREQAWPKIDLDPKRLMTWSIVGMIVLLAFMTLRNLPGWPFAYLRPLP